MYLKLIQCILILTLLATVGCKKDEPIEETQDTESPVLDNFQINNQVYEEDNITVSRTAEFILRVGYNDESSINNRSIELVINDDTNLTKELILNQTTANSFSYTFGVFSFEEIIFDNPDVPYITNPGDEIKFIMIIKDEFDNSSEKIFVVNLIE